MSQEFQYPEFDEQGMKILSRAGDLPNDMMMDIAVFHLRAGEQLSFCQETAETAVLLVKGQVGREDVAGPVGIAVNLVGKTYEESKQYGWQSVMVNMMNITLMLSVNLGIINLLPLPALDGGRLMFMLIEVVRGKPVPPDKEGMVHFAGLIFFMVLMVLVLFNDIANILL